MHKVNVLSVKEVNSISKICMITLERPIDYTWNIGSYLCLDVDNNKHYFSITNAPNEDSIALLTNNLVVIEKIREFGICLISRPYSQFDFTNINLIIAAGTGITAFLHYLNTVEKPPKTIVVCKTKEHSIYIPSIVQPIYLETTKLTRVEVLSLIKFEQMIHSHSLVCGPKAFIADLNIIKNQ